MTYYYDQRRDRVIDLRGGICGPGMHDFLMDEIELGFRAAATIDEPDQAWWAFHPGPTQ